MPTEDEERARRQAEAAEQKKREASTSGAGAAKEDSMSAALEQMQGLLRQLSAGTSTAPTSTTAPTTSKKSTPRSMRPRTRELPSKEAQSAARSALKTIERLVDNIQTNNWDTWSLRVKNALVLGRVDDVVFGNFVEPDDLSSTDGELFSTKDDMAYAYIVEVLPDSIARSVHDMTARDVWTWLERKYSIPSTSKYQAILNGLSALKASSESAMPAYLSQHEQLYEQARSIDFALVQDVDPSSSPLQQLQVRTGNMTYSKFILDGLPKTQHWTTFRDVYEMSSPSYNPRELLDKISSDIRDSAIRTRTVENNPLLSSPSSSSNGQALATTKKPPMKAKAQPCPVCGQPSPRHTPDKCWSNPKNPKNKLGEEGFKPKFSDRQGDKKEKKEKGKKGKEKSAATTEGGGGDDEWSFGYEPEGGGNASAAVGGDGCEGFYVDSCSSIHIIKERDAFTDYEKYVDKVSAANGTAMPVIGRGTAIVKTVVDGKPHDLVLRSAYHIPSSTYNLISVPSLVISGHAVKFGTKGTFEISKDGIVVARGRGGVAGLPKLSFLVYGTAERRRQAVVAAHRRFGHPGQAVMREMLKSGLVDGFNLADLAAFYEEPCKACVQGKATSLPFPSSTTRPRLPLESLSTDIAGEIPDTSFSGFRWFIHLTDGATGWVEVEAMKLKAETREAVERMLLRMKYSFRNTEVSPTPTLISDNAQEYLSADFRQMLARHGILHHRSLPYTPQQNGRAERFVRLLKEKANSLLVDASLPPIYWAEALRHTVYLHNRLPSPAHDMKSPFELVYGRPDYAAASMPLFGQHVWVKKSNVAPFRPKAEEARFMSYALVDGQKGMRVKLVDSVAGGGIKVVRNVYYSRTKLEEKIRSEMSDEEVEEEEERAEEPAAENAEFVSEGGTELASSTRTSSSLAASTAQRTSQEQV